MGLKRPDKSNMAKRADSKLPQSKQQASKPVVRTKQVEPEPVEEDVVVSNTTSKKKVSRSPANKVVTKKVVKKAAAKKLTKANIIKIKDTNAYSMALVTSMNGATNDNMILPLDNKNFTHLVMPLPLCLQILLQANGLPFSSVVELAGDKGSNKSALLLEFGAIVNGQRYFAPDYMGFMDYLSAETKFPEAMNLAITGYPDELRESRPGSLAAVYVHKGDSMDAWMTRGLDRAEVYAKNGDPTRAVPYILGIDSIAAKLLDETTDKIASEGVPSRQFSREAQAIKRWISTYQGIMAEWPSILIAINHVARDPIPGTRSMSRHKPGGRYLGFAESVDLDLAASGKTVKTTAPEGYPVPYIATNKIKITVAKNSLGETHNSCFGYVRWHYYWPAKNMLDPDSPRQHMRWLWGKTLVEMLNTYDAHTNLDAHGKSMLRDICHVEVVVKTRDLWRCRQLPETENGIPADELGQMIELNTKMRMALQAFYGVTRYSVYEPMTNYAKQMQIQRKVKAKEDSDSDN